MDCTELGCDKELEDELDTLAGGGNQELEDELDTLDAFVALGGERDRSGSSGLWNQ